MNGNIEGTKSLQYKEKNGYYRPCRLLKQDVTPKVGAGTGFPGRVALANRSWQRATAADLSSATLSRSIISILYPLLCIKTFV
jgi:hypothetical protein